MWRRAANENFLSNDAEQIYAAAEEVRREIGDVDLLFNCAGLVIGKPMLVSATSGEKSPGRFSCEEPERLARLTMAVNASALITTTKAFLPAMLDRNDGHIITVCKARSKEAPIGARLRHKIAISNSSLSSIIYVHQKSVKK